MRPSAITVTTLLLLAACSEPAGQRTPAVDPLVGAWQSEVAFRDGSLAATKGLQFMYAFNSGGTLTESSNYDGAPPVPPAYGSWRLTSPGRYELHYVFFTSQPPADWNAVTAGGGWLPSGRGELHETITMAADGRSFTSTMSLSLFDASGRLVAGGGSATGHGTRIAF